MGLRINTNIAALTAQRYLGSSGNAMNVSLERLSSGMRINRAADNPAGLVTSEKQRAVTSFFILTFASIFHNYQ